MISKWKKARHLRDKWINIGCRHSDKAYSHSIKELHNSHQTALKTVIKTTGKRNTILDRRIERLDILIKQNEQDKFTLKRYLQQVKLEDEKRHLIGDEVLNRAALLKDYSNRLNEIEKEVLRRFE